MLVFVRLSNRDLNRVNNKCMQVVLFSLLGKGDPLVFLPLGHIIYFLLRPPSNKCINCQIQVGAVLWAPAVATSIKEIHKLTNTGRLYCGPRLALGETAFLLCAAPPLVLVKRRHQLALTIHMASSYPPPPPPPPPSPSPPPSSIPTTRSILLNLLYL